MQVPLTKILEITEAITEPSMFTNQKYKRFLVWKTVTRWLCDTVEFQTIDCWNLQFKTRSTKGLELNRNGLTLYVLSCFAMTMDVGKLQLKHCQFSSIDFWPDIITGVGPIHLMSKKSNTGIIYFRAYFAICSKQGIKYHSKKAHYILNLWQQYGMLLQGFFATKSFTTMCTLVSFKVFMKHSDMCFQIIPLCETFHTRYTLMR